MAGKKRERFQNPKPFLPVDDASTAASKKRSKAPKRHQDHEKTISETMSSKILREALIQQREIQEEENKAQNPDNLGFSDAVDERVEEEEDIDDFTGYTDSQSHEDYEEKIDEADEKLLEAFLSKENGQQRSLADIIAAKIRQQDAAVSSEARPEPKLDNSVIELYKGVGKALSVYTSGKVPKAFKHIPSMRFLDDSREMPVIWHQSLLAFIQRYKNEILKEDKVKLKKLMEKQNHRLVTPEILRELDESRNRGEKEDDAMLISAPISVINRTIVEDRFDIPEVPMEED